MSDSKRPDPPADDAASAARAFTERSTTTASRISALVADAGLGCRFQSIVTPAGLPFAEIALLFASTDGRSHTEQTILRIATVSELAKGAASFRRRAIAEFAAAPGMPPSLLLYFPYYAALPDVEAIGPPLADLLAEHRLLPGRLIAEVLVPPNDAERAAAPAHVAWLRAVGVQVSLRVEGPDDRARETVEELTPDFVHIVRPPRSMHDVEVYRPFLRDVVARHARPIIGGVKELDDAQAVEGLRVDLSYGDAIAPPRFLC